jgi:hypothetical protein
MVEHVESKKLNKKVKDYLLTRILGEGSFGIVYEGIHT